MFLSYRISLNQVLVLSVFRCSFAFIKIILFIALGIFFEPFQSGENKKKYAIGKQRNFCRCDHETLVGRILSYISRFSPIGLKSVFHYEEMGLGKGVLSKQGCFSLLVTLKTDFPYSIISNVLMFLTPQYLSQSLSDPLQRKDQKT